MMRDSELDKLMKDTAETYNHPLEVPRERMWERIDAARANRRGQRAGNQPLRLLRHPAFIWPLAAAALIILGIAIGRVTTSGDFRADPDQAPAVTLEAPALGDQLDLKLYRPLTQAVFAKAEALLTNVCMDSGMDNPDNPLPIWAGSLLIQTRLLMDTPVVGQSDVKALLEDLELVLAQIVQASSSKSGNECDWIIGGMEERATLARLRNRNHAGHTPASL